MKYQIGDRVKVKEGNFPIFMGIARDGDGYGALAGKVVTIAGIHPRHYKGYSVTYWVKEFGSESADLWIDDSFEGLADELVVDNDCNKDEDKMSSIADSDIINHPSHYCFGGMEAIDEMETVFGTEAVMHFCLLNVWKYRKRALRKNGEQDIQKSDWYMNKYKELKNKIVAAEAATSSHF